MKRFLLHIFLFFLPLIGLTLPYIVIDPFRVLYTYDGYTSYRLKVNESFGSKKCCVTTNRGFIGMRTFVRNHSQIRYDSFIFGDSRSGFYQIDDWKQCIGDTCSCIHMGGFAESLYMIHMKLKYITPRVEMKHVLIPLDNIILSQVEEPTDLLQMPAPEFGWRYRVRFHVAHFRAYLNENFFPYFIESFWKGKWIDPHSSKAFDAIEYSYEPYTCQVGEVGKDKQDMYHGGDSIVISVSESPVLEQLINERQKFLLAEIRDMLEEEGCDYRIILDPLSDQRTYCESDMLFLYTIFRGHLYDYSGKNVLSENPSNYRDPGHYHSGIARQIMNEIYQ